jgi:hypothetical protein
LKNHPKNWAEFEKAEQEVDLIRKKLKHERLKDHRIKVRVLDSIRVTRWACEKVAQSEAQPILFCQN